MKQRRGVSLIELIVVIATSGVVMSIAVWTLSMLMCSERGGAERLENATAYARLSQQFRSDVHAAVSTSGDPGAVNGAVNGADEIQLTLPEGRQVTYRQNGKEVVREVLTRQQPTGRESYRIKRNSRARFTVEAEQGKNWAILSWESAPPEEEIPPASQLRSSNTPPNIEAQLAKDHRFMEDRP